MDTRDHQVFDEQVLANGINTYVYSEQSRYSIASITVPVGSASSFGTYLPGTFHFLEHLLYNRSQAYPKLNEYRKLTGLKGGSFNASTYPLYTRYFLSCPSEHFAELWKGLFSAVFQPHFVERDFQIERGTIISERRKKERWFPGSTELGRYVDTEWLYDIPLSLEQRLGSDDNLASMNKDMMERAHAGRYFIPGITLVAAGSANFQPLMNSLAQLDINKASPPTRYEALRWENQQYHTHSFRDINRHVLRLGGIVAAKPDYLRSRGRTFILEYLTNSTHGSLFTWLREDLGWVYEMGYSTMRTVDSQSLWTLRFPLANQQQVETVRREYHERIASALRDQSAVDAEVDRIKSLFQAYSYSLLGQVVDDAHSTLEQRGKILSEHAYLNYLEKYRDTSFLHDVWAEASDPTAMGSFCAMPITTS